MIARLLSRVKEWRKRRYWASRHFEFVRNCILDDLQWISGYSPVARVLLERYEKMLAPDWYSQEHESVYTLRDKIILMAQTHQPNCRSNSLPDTTVPARDTEYTRMRMLKGTVILTEDAKSWLSQNNPELFDMLDPTAVAYSIFIWEKSRDQPDTRLHLETEFANIIRNALGDIRGIAVRSKKVPGYEISDQWPEMGETYTLFEGVRQSGL